MIDSARMYKNEAKVGQAVRESGVPRSEIFVGEYMLYSFYQNGRSSTEDNDCSIEDRRT